MPNEQSEAMNAVLDEAGVLVELDAARAEAWASGLLAEWPDHDELLARLDASDHPAALAIARALAPMLPSGSAVADRLQGRGLPAPAFAEHVGTASPVGAWTIRDPYGTGMSVVVEYEHADGVRHDMLVEVVDGVAVDLLVGPPGVVATARDEADRPLEVAEVATTEALEHIRSAMFATRVAVVDADVPLTDAYLLNHALVAARVGLPVRLRTDDDRRDAPGRARREPDPEGDALAVSTLRAALGRGAPTAPPAAAVLAGAAALREAVAQRDAAALALVSEAGIDDPDGVDDDELLVRVAGAYVRPGPRVGVSPAAADAIDALESADWLGAVLPLVRDGAGAHASPEQLVRNINRCPEVTTSIPKRDAPAVASAFGCTLDAWRVTGVIDDNDRVTELGVWLLPRALERAWAVDER